MEKPKLLSAREMLLQECTSRHFASSPKSPEYILGFQSALAMNFKMVDKVSNPYPAQTAEHDAWLAGRGAGFDAVDRGANMRALKPRLEELERCAPRHIA